MKKSTPSSSFFYQNKRNTHGDNNPECPNGVVVVHDKMKEKIFDPSVGY
jgi:hypothetical protein